MNVHEETDLRRFLDRMASEAPVAPIETAPTVARAKRGLAWHSVLLAILSFVIAGAAVATSRALLRSSPQPYGQAPASVLPGPAVIATNGQLMLVSPGGSAPLTTDGVWAPIGFSPDGTTLLAQRLSGFRPGPNYGMPGYHPGPSPTRAELVAIHLDTGRQTTLGRITPGEADATWSPDGRSIASVDEGRLSIIDVATGTASIAAEHVANQQVSWSPDGSLILYVGFQGHRTGIFTVTADGSDRSTVLIEHRCVKSDRRVYCDGPWSAAWSPDGMSIAYTYSKYTHHRKGRHVAHTIMVMGTDGSNAHQVSDKATDELVWSPDGSSIAFISSSSGVYEVAADGSGWRELAAFGFDVRWSSDGSMVSFGCESGICLRQLDEVGSPTFPLSDHTSSQNGGTVAWQPVR